MRRSLDLRQIALAILLASLATIGGFLVFEHGLGLRPCKLCLMERNPYYLAVPIALVALVVPPRLARLALLVLAVVFVVGAGLGIYHAGAEWGFFAGPNDCGGTPAPTVGSMDEFMKQLQSTKVVSCTEAAWRLFGLSLAGWNVVISIALAAFALWGAAAGRSPAANQAKGSPANGRYGSSSLSQ